MEADFETYYQRLVSKSRNQALLYVAGVVIFCAILWFYSNPLPVIMLGGICFLLIFILYRRSTNKYYQRLHLLNISFPETWQDLLEKNSVFYANLSPADKKIFNQRVQFFLAEKKVEGIDTNLDDTVRLLVAASAIIPTFAFPFFEYPNLKQVLIYPNAFDEKFRTEHTAGQERIIAGMVGNMYLNNTLLLSKPNLLAGFQNQDNSNVGIHEFVHLLDKADGAIDGLPEIFLNNAYAIPWLQVLKAEVKKMKKGQSDINPYGLTNNAEFLAVVSEYFFDNPEKLNQNHPELYRLLCTIFQQDPERSR
ncbi:M90 family metallopeptidase [Adhaeribacter rhizoryzae]|nr:M90 family metallopeptidase [Adhaeribacter rhizoryzae]